MAELTLRWEKFGLSRGLHDMLGAGELVDVTLACQGELLQAHKSVLAACSQQFRHIFLMNPCQHPVIFMQDVQLPHLQALLSFMYTGEATVHQRALTGFMKTAEALKVSGLTDSSRPSQPPSSAVEEPSGSPAPREDPPPPSKRARRSRGVEDPAPPPPPVAWAQEPASSTAAAAATPQMVKLEGAPDTAGELWNADSQDILEEGDDLDGDMDSNDQAFSDQMDPSEVSDPLAWGASAVPGPSGTPGDNSSGKRKRPSRKAGEGWGDLESEEESEDEEETRRRLLAQPATSRIIVEHEEDKRAKRSKHLRQLLSRTSLGRLLLSSNTLDDQRRKKLVKLVAEHIVASIRDSSTMVRAEVYEAWTQEIVNLFWNEKPEVYYVRSYLKSGRKRSTGKLHSRVNYIRQDFNKWSKSIENC